MPRTGTSRKLRLPAPVPPPPAGHQDYDVLKVIVDALLGAAGGEGNLKKIMADIARDNIDRVIQTPKTGRRLYTDLQNSEKTYIGTAVEIDLRSALSLGRGENMDLEIAGHDVDVKFSQGKGWMIPPEAVGKACVLVTASDIINRYSLGVIVAREEYLNKGKNRDGKRTINAKQRVNIWWLIQNEEYPRNFWLDVPREVVERISKGKSGNDRATIFLREVLDRPFNRKIVADVGEDQEDFMRRFRGDAGAKNGTRDTLLKEGILAVHGHRKKPRALMKKFGIELRHDQFVSHRLKPEEYEAARAAGYKV